MTSDWILGSLSGFSAFWFGRVLYKLRRPRVLLMFSVLRSSEILRLSLLDDDNVEDEDDSKDRADFSGGGRHTTVQ